MEIVRICDGKRGHENQSLGLVEALARRSEVRCTELSVRGNSLRTAWRLAISSPAPAQLVIGAGHATHFPMLALARRTQAKSVVLMKPTLPMGWFDLCIVPAHDGVTEGDGVMLSLGALNRVKPAAAVESDLCLVLIGGPSRHNAWDNDTLLRQIRELQSRYPHWRLLLVTSRRTPNTTLERLAALAGDRLELIPFERTEGDWLATHLPRAAMLWVSEDSVSMAYEAASVDAQLGLLEVPEFRQGRTRRAVQALLDSGRAVSFTQCQQGQPLERPGAPLAEADRCAEAILQRWPQLS